MSTPTAITLAIEILREDMRALVDCHAHLDTGVIPPDEPEARAAFDRYCAAINGLEELADQVPAQQAAQPVARRTLHCGNPMTAEIGAAQSVAGEPVAWRVEVDGLWLLARDREGLISAIETNDQPEPLYTAAPALVGLVPMTLDQIGEMEWGAACIGLGWDVRVSAVRAVERAHGIRAGKDGAHG